MDSLNLGDRIVRHAQPPGRPGDLPGWEVTAHLRGEFCGMGCTSHEYAPFRDVGSAYEHGLELVAGHRPGPVVVGVYSDSGEFTPLWRRYGATLRRVRRGATAGPTAAARDLRKGRTDT